MVESFGDGRRRREGEVPAGDVPTGDELRALLPPGLLRTVIVPELDEDALGELAEQIEDVVERAVRRGLVRGLGSQMDVVDDDAGDGEREGGAVRERPVRPRSRSAVPFDTHPTVNGNDVFAYKKYAQRLDDTHPDWYRHAVDMAPELAAEALRRRERDRRAVANMAGGR